MNQGSIYYCRIERVIGLFVYAYLSCIEHIFQVSEAAFYRPCLVTTKMLLHYTAVTFGSAIYRTSKVIANSNGQKMYIYLLSMYATVMMSVAFYAYLCWHR